MLTPENVNTEIRSILVSNGNAFWDALTPEIQRVNEPSILKTQALLMQFFPAPYSSPSVLPSRELGLQKTTVRQTDNENCSFISVANGLRILAGPNIEFTLLGLKKRYIQIFSHDLNQIRGTQVLESLFSSGEPFDQFNALSIPKPLVSGRPFPMDLYQLFRKFQDGAVGILDCPYSPLHTSRQGVDYTHARTITGFSSTLEGIFFHVIDPYDPVEKPWSFRDLMTACTFETSMNYGLKFDDYDSVARSILIIEKKKPSGIKTAILNS